jgi:hypothetical protein
MMACVIATGGGASGEHVAANPSVFHSIYRVAASPEVEGVETDSEKVTGTFAKLPWSGSGAPAPVYYSRYLLVLTSYSGILGAGE